MADDRKREESDTEDNSASKASATRRTGNKLVDKQRSQIDYLMRNIDKPIKLPTVSEKPLLKPPPEIVLNVRGSSAGAGSSDFSIYRDLRRKENMRVKLMETEAAKDSANDAFTQEIESLKRKDEEKTAKNRAKRQKRKSKAKGAKKLAS
ncbi:PRKR-interacting protein 1 [Coemansia sp. RSA 2706]